LSLVTTIIFAAIYSANLGELSVITL